MTKLSKIEYEKNRFRHLTDQELEHKIRNRGTDYDKLIYYHNLHKSFESNLVDALKKMGISVRIVNRYNYSNENIKWADVILPIGGDGTFLFAASRIQNNRKNVIGFNSDPNRSEGHLCLPKKYSTDIRSAIERLQEGDYRTLFRSRIRTTLICNRNDNIRPEDLYESNTSVPNRIDKIINGRILPYLALNEVFIGEKLSARVSHLGMWLNDDEQRTNLKCSGICVCTGTGSTSWHLSINRIPVQSVADLLILLDMNPTSGKDSLATLLANMYNENLVFSPEEKRMGYTIRDIISAGVWPQPKGIKSRGFATKIKLQSHCFDACLVIDGGVSFAFNDGTIAITEIHPQDSLRTVTLL